jgi:anti-sigma factor RsiW
VSAADCRSLRPLLGAYLLGGLEPAEAAEVRAHLSTCPSCAAEHARLAPLPGLLTLATGAEAATEEPPSAALEERLLDAVAREAPKRRRPRFARPRAWLALGGATAVAAAAALGFLVLGGDDEPGYGVTLRTAAAAPATATGGARFQEVSGGTTMHVWVKGLPRNSSAVYEVQCDAPGWSASAGTFRVDAKGDAYVVLTTAVKKGQYDQIRLVRREHMASGKVVPSDILTAKLS